MIMENNTVTIQSPTVLVADAGGTGTTWIAAGPDGSRRSLVTAGINAATMPVGYLDDIVSRLVKPWLGDVGCLEIHYYGAGVTDPSRQEMVAASLAALHPAATSVYSDLLGACRAVAGDRPMVVGILGTGSNSCLYDGERIVRNIPSLGYILGDEGSGAWMGRRLLGDALKGLLPDDVTRALGVDAATVIEAVYRGKRPAAYLASWVGFIADHLDVPAIAAIVDDGLEAFVTRSLGRYGSALPVGMVGGLAAMLRDNAAGVCERHGLQLAAVVADPAPALVSYHCKSPLDSI